MLLACCCAAEEGLGRKEQVQTVELFNGQCLDAPGTSHMVAGALAEEEADNGGWGPRPFLACISRESGEDRWGWRVDLLNDAAVYVCRVEGGEYPVGRYNASAPEVLRIRPGDFIMSVNSDSSSSLSMSEVLQAEEDVRLVIQRPELYTAVVEEVGSSLGIEVKFSSGLGAGDSMVVENIDDRGPVMRSAPQVRIGDRLLSVNGSPASHAAMLEALRSGGRMVLSFARLPPPLTEAELTALLEGDLGTSS
mmetsp:Transcript_6271/g.17990  ORF Transcript_6271/g.17990 Transcript_6271/m.17990 type:complete len:250 (-) Transcript_6271:102-851(-)